MGCSQSKIDNEEAVSRCRERKQHMKEAVAARNAFASAHSAYVMAMKNTGAAISDYGQGEVDVDKSAAPKIAPMDHLPPPPPPLPDFSPGPLHRSVSMPDLAVPKSDPKPSETIQEEEEVGYRDEGSSAAPPPPPPPPLLSSSSSHPVPAPPPPESHSNSTWDYFFAPTESHLSATTLSEEPTPIKEAEEEEEEKKQHNLRRSTKKEVKVESVVVVVEPVTPEKVIEPAAKPLKKPKQGGGSVQHVGPSTEPKRGNKSPNLLQILNELDDHFLRASESAHEVSKMLEANRLHYHSNFADNRGHIDHSARVMRVITWNRSFRGMQNADDGKDDFEPEKDETHATILDKLLAWEKKLYDEVKEGERMKIDYQRKVSLLNKQKKRGTNPEAIEKAKAAVSHLHTRYIVDMQSMDSTVTEIRRLRDELLYPRLVDLVNEMAKMWEAMYANHNSQLKIVADLRSLDISNAPKETIDQHHHRTVQLWRIADEWHVQFEKLVSHQKQYVQALNSWLRVNMVSIESNLKEKVSSPPRVQQPPIHALLQAWHDSLEKLPDKLAKNAIHSFAAVINAIVVHQEEELKQKEKCEDLKKECTRKAKAFEEWHHKYLQRRVAGEAADPERIGGEGNSEKEDQVLLDRQVAVEALKKKSEEEVEVHQKLCKQVREKSLGSLKTHLPELFRTMSDFAFACSETYKKVHALAPPFVHSHPDQNSTY